MAVCKPFFLRAADLSQHPSGLVTASVSPVTASVSPVTASVWPVTAPVRPAQHPSRLSQTHLAWHSIRPARHNTRLTRHNARGVRVSGYGFVLQDVAAGPYFGGWNNTLEYKAAVAGLGAARSGDL